MVSPGNLSEKRVREIVLEVEIENTKVSLETIRQSERRKWRQIYYMLCGNAIYLLVRDGLTWASLIALMFTALLLCPLTWLLKAPVRLRILEHEIRIKELTAKRSASDGALSRMTDAEPDADRGLSHVDAQ